MDVVIICNGLGNQMSQYAFYLKKKTLKKNTRFIFDRGSSSQHNGYELSRIFKIRYNVNLTDSILYALFRFLQIKRFPAISGFLIKIFRRIGICIVNEPYNYDYDENLLGSTKGIRFFYGGWHSEKYFSSIENEVRNAFNFDKGYMDEQTIKILDEIRNTNSVSIHVRRGDYLSEANLSTYGAVCNAGYFHAAIEKMTALIQNPHFYVYSNDVLWVKENLLYDNLTIVDYNKGINSYKDMYLISNCKHNINSNSTFSWWGAWLNPNKDKVVIVPEAFMYKVATKDVYPENWLCIGDY